MTDASRAALHDALAPHDGSRLAAFAEAVVRQVAHPLAGEWIVDAAADDASPGGREVAVARRLGLLLATAAGRAAAEPDAFDHAAAELARDVALLSACWQNLDLVPAGDVGDAVAMLVARALERLDRPSIG